MDTFPTSPRASGKKYQVTEHAVLFGEYELQLDDKHRMLIPAEVRRQLDPARDGEAFFLVIGTQRRLWFLPEKLYYAQAHQFASRATPSPEILAYQRSFFSNARKVEWDKQGRIVVPEILLQRTNTGSEVTLIGLGDRLELWNRSEWLNQLPDMIANSGALAMRVDELQQKTAPQS